MADPERAKEQSRYYRLITEEFLRRRGAPLILAPGDFPVLAGWEARRIPLDAVLEGIRGAFEFLSMKGRPARGLKLKYCEPFVDRALAQHKERRAGAGRSAAAPMPGAAQTAKRARALAAVEAWLASAGGTELELRARLERATELLRCPVPDEAALERLDGEVDELLRAEGDPGRLKILRKEEAAARLRPGSGPDIDGLAGKRLAKEEREKRRVPYFSLFYY